MCPKWPGKGTMEVDGEKEMREVWKWMGKGNERSVVGHGRETRKYMRMG